MDENFYFYTIDKLFYRYRSFKTGAQKVYKIKLHNKKWWKYIYTQTFLIKGYIGECVSGLPA